MYLKELYYLDCCPSVIIMKFLIFEILRMLKLRWFGKFSLPADYDFGEPSVIFFHCYVYGIILDLC